MSDLRARGNLQEINSLLRPTAHPALAYRKKKKKENQRLLPARCRAISTGRGSLLAEPRLSPAVSSILVGCRRWEVRAG